MKEVSSIVLLGTSHRDIALVFWALHETDTTTVMLYRPCGELTNARQLCTWSSCTLCSLATDDGSRGGNLMLQFWRLFLQHDVFYLKCGARILSRHRCCAEYHLQYITRHSYSRTPYITAILTYKLSFDSKRLWWNVNFIYLYINLFPEGKIETLNLRFNFLV